jgi:hypothetical protein
MLSGKIYWHTDDTGWTDENGSFILLCKIKGLGIAKSSAIINLFNGIPG